MPPPLPHLGDRIGRKRRKKEKIDNIFALLKITKRYLYESCYFRSDATMDQE